MIIKKIGKCIIILLVIIFCPSIVFADEIDDAMEGRFQEKDVVSFGEYKGVKLYWNYLFIGETNSSSKGIFYFILSKESSEEINILSNPADGKVVSWLNDKNEGFLKVALNNDSRITEVILPWSPLYEIFIKHLPKEGVYKHNCGVKTIMVIHELNTLLLPKMERWIC